jgi:hypothetical protein
MWDPVLKFVQLDHDETTEERGEPDVVDCGVDVGPCALLGGGVGGLEDKGALGYEEDAG